MRFYSLKEKGERNSASLIHFGAQIIDLVINVRSSFPPRRQFLSKPQPKWRNHCLSGFLLAVNHASRVLRPSGGVTWTNPAALAAELETCFVIM
jgi:hypothetical protein